MKPWAVGNEQFPRENHTGLCTVLLCGPYPSRGRKRAVRLYSLNNSDAVHTPHGDENASGSGSGTGSGSDAVHTPHGDENVPVQHRRTDFFGCSLHPSRGQNKKRLPHRIPLLYGRRFLFCLERKAGAFRAARHAIRLCFLQFTFTPFSCSSYPAAFYPRSWR